ncbi:SapC family protein [Sphingomonas sp. Root241]|uniref:SapC family protein n=1 Tax=Sphingomonas sp. Root241 TaxID=1736501 RepID=UPI0007012DF4|nr:SapC family protein [Sphingomonas sp. Root241]KRC81465.1 multidrug transporter [Sphingomonas sp. Root241]
MASAPGPQLPLFYKELVPLNSRQHGGWRSRTTDKATWLANQHAVPLTVEEFGQAQRHFPIVFSVGDKPIPLALMGLNEGVNVFVSEDGALPAPIYVPAYARRYPFMLARLSAENTDLSLCFDPTTDLVGDFADGAPLFENDNPTDSCKATLGFCEQFEVAGQKTEAFIAELEKHALLIDGEITIQPESGAQPFVYRGFRMVDEAKLRDLPGEVLREWNGSGMLPLVFFHLASLQLVRDIFARQLQLGEGSPVQA